MTDSSDHTAPKATPAAGTGTTTRLRIRQMDCPTEEALLRRVLGQRPDVQALQFDLVQRILTLTHAPDSLEAIEQAIRALDFTPEPITTEDPPAPAPAASWWPLILSGLAALAAEITHWMATPFWIPAVLAVSAVAGCGLGTYRKGWTAIRHGQLNINALMSIAVTGAFILGQWAEAAMVMVLYTLAEHIEARSLDRARNAIQGLLQLAPAQALVQQDDGQWRMEAVARLAPGRRIRVRPGERIALDGRVVAGHSTVDQSPITGESLPVEKTVDDLLYAGTINGAGSLEFLATAPVDASMLARIIHTIEAAQAAKAPTQRFVDRFARIYTPLVVLAALALALVPPLAAGGEWTAWAYRALVLLVIACPCALVISTPVSIVSGLAAASRHGVLIKGGHFLEQGHRLRWLALDKTGTLTQGRPSLVASSVLDPTTPATLCHALTRQLASHSDHPVSRAVARGLATREAPVAAPGPVSDFQALPGQGVQATLNGQRHLLGNHRLIHAHGLCSPALEAHLETLERKGQTVVLLADEHRALALYAVADRIKPDSVQAIANLHAAGIQTAILSGDNPHTVAALAEHAGVDRALGNLLPEDKLAFIDELATTAAPVGMVGDGINDAPALARADIGFAMGAMGTDVAIETADIAIMDDDLRKIPWFIGLSRATHRVLVQNIALALVIKAVFLALAVFGLATLWMAVFADVGASLLVVANGLRLLRHAKPAGPSAPGGAAPTPPRASTVPDRPHPASAGRPAQNARFAPPASHWQSGRSHPDAS